jgi:uncharacterized protein (TIGR02145 family)
MRSLVALSAVSTFACISIPQPPPAPKPSGSLTDADGNVYATVVVGNEEWMQENLKTTTYSDGTPIPNVTDEWTWAGLTSGAYSWVDNDDTNKDVYGGLYNWYAVDTGKLCPDGWSVPTSSAWEPLIDKLGGQPHAGGALKEAGTAHWDAPNTGATNQSGFTALGAGQRNVDGTFDSKGQYAFWWCSDQDDFPFTYLSWLWTVNDADTTTGGSTADRAYGHSVRCMHGVTP